MRVATGKPGNARLVIQTWLLTRGLMALLVGALLATSSKTAQDLLANWDVQHFFAIARDGYAQPTDIAFFPGWPLLLRLGSMTGLPMLAVGTVLALAGSALAAAALYRMAGAPAAIAWLLAPTAVFTMVPYTESLFVAAAFWAWERARAKQWGTAALLASVAASVRVSGIFLILALGVLALTTPGSRRTKGQRLAWLLLPTGVVVAYGTYLHSLTGSWLAWYHAQSTGWARGFTWPWESLQHTLDAILGGGSPEHPEWAWVFAGEVVSMVVGLLVTVICLWRRQWGEATWVGVQVAAFSVSYWFMSVNRAVLLWFPLWILLGELVPSRGRMPPWRGVVIGLLVALVLVTQLVWAWLFFTGRWAS